MMTSDSSNRVSLIGMLDTTLCTYASMLSESSGYVSLKKYAKAHQLLVYPCRLCEQYRCRIDVSVRAFAAVSQGLQLTVSS